MTYRPFRLLLPVIAFLSLTAGRLAATPSVDYTVGIDIPNETFRVHTVINETGAESLVFNFPIWGPGAYDIVNFGKYVKSLDAKQGGRTLQVARIDSNSFRITGASGNGPIEIDYAVRDIEKVPNSLWFGLTDIESNFVFANTVAIFGYADGYKQLPCTAAFETPKGWEISVGLDKLEGAAARGRKNVYVARDYDELVDMPMQMGKFQKTEFTLQGKPHVITVTAPRKLTTAELNGLRDTTKMIVGWVSSIFGNLPYDRYIFQHYLVDLNAVEQGDFSFGALEHRNSSTYRMPLYNQATPAQVLAGVIAHEYWHLWSPKRIHVAELGPFDYQRPPHTNSLWFAEGLTEYYAQVILARHNMKDPEEGGMLGKLVNGGMGQPSVFERTYRQPQPESMASLSMRVAEAPLSEVVDVYAKGPVVVMLLDIAIRSQTNNRVTMDSVMRYFNNEYGKTGRTFGDDDIITIMEKASGTSLQDFYQKYIKGTEPLPYDELLPKAGFKITENTEQKRKLGAQAQVSGDGVKIVGITPGGNAEKMGLREGDEVVAVIIQDNRVPMHDLLEKLAQFGATLTQMMEQSPTDGAVLVVRRDGKEQEVPLKLVSQEVKVYSVEADSKATGTALAIRKDITGS